MFVTENERQHLLEKYQNRRVFHGQLHDHAATGGTSDGKIPLSDWVIRMKELQLDFAAILDHRQVRHMYLPEWKQALFLCGTEPGTHIPDSHASLNEMHYNLLVDSPEKLQELLLEFPEYAFSGGSEGHFVYPDFSRQRFGELIDALKAKGGMFVLPHPKQYMQSEDPLDYWYRDWTGMEVFYQRRYETVDNPYTQSNYALWRELLRLGKRIWPCAGSDRHRLCTDGALTTVYAEEATNASLLSRLRIGDFTCGGIGIRMCVGDTVSGGECLLAGKRLIICISDFHSSLYRENHTYRVDVYGGEDCVKSQIFTGIECEGSVWLALDTADVPFYRVELLDVTDGQRIALGSPIWNTP